MRMIKMATLACSLQLTGTALAATAHVPKSQQTRLPDAEENIRDLTDEERQAVEKIPVYQDLYDPNTYYYVSFLTVLPSTPWSETRNQSVFGAAEALDRLLKGYGDQFIQAALGVSSEQASDPMAEAILQTDEQKAARLQAQLDRLSGIQQRAFIEAVRVQAIRAGLNLPSSGQLDLVTASQLTATILNLSAVEVVVPVGWGLDTGTFQAFRKYRQKNPSLTIVRLASDPWWDIERKPHLSDSTNADTMVDYSMQANLGAALYQSRDTRISAAGGNLSLNLAFNGARGWGHGQQDPNDPTASNLHLDALLKGFLSQKQTLDLHVEAEITCKFKATVIENQSITSSKYPGGAIVFPSYQETPNDPIEIAECIARNPATGEIVANPTSALYQVVEAKKDEFIKRYTAAYDAAVSLKASLLRNAQSRADQWLLQPLPTEARVLRDTTTSRQCSLTWGPEHCVEWGKKWDYRRFTNRKYCKRTARDPQHDCYTTYRAIDRIVNVELPAYYFDRVRFEQALDAEDTFRVGANEVVALEVTAPNFVCLSRRVSAGGLLQRRACGLKEFTNVAPEGSVDEPVDDSPVIVIGG